MKANKTFWEDVTRAIVAAILAGGIILLVVTMFSSCAMIEPYEPEYEQLSAVGMKRAYKDYRQACKRGETDDTFIGWLNNDSGNEVYLSGECFTENDSIIECDTLIYWIKE
ncbi:MAG: hypothetical protein WC998_05520 [Candidatus Paceibacterota bacterium]|jgi:hypothetical protein